MDLRLIFTSERVKIVLNHSNLSGNSWSDNCLLEVDVIAFLVSRRKKGNFHSIWLMIMFASFRKFLVDASRLVIIIRILDTLSIGKAFARA